MQARTREQAALNLALRSRQRPSKADVETARWCATLTKLTEGMAAMESALTSLGVRDGAFGQEDWWRIEEKLLSESELVARVTPNGLQNLMDARLRGAGRVFALRSGAVLMSRRHDPRWFVAGVMCTTCGLPIPEEHPAGRTCDAVSCLTGVPTIAEIEAVLAGLNDELAGMIRVWGGANRPAWNTRPTTEEMVSSDYTVHACTGIDWAATLALRPLDPEKEVAHRAYILVDGSAVVQEGIEPWHHVPNFREYAATVSGR